MMNLMLIHDFIEQTLQAFCQDQEVQSSYFDDGFSETNIVWEIHALCTMHDVPTQHRIWNVSYCSHASLMQDGKLMTGRRYPSSFFYAQRPVLEVQGRFYLVDHELHVQVYESLDEVKRIQHQSLQAKYHNPERQVGKEVFDVREDPSFTPGMIRPTHLYRHQETLRHYFLEHHTLWMAQEEAQRISNLIEAKHLNTPDTSSKIKPRI